jgi:hypothetical protein
LNFDGWLSIMAINQELALDARQKPLENAWWQVDPIIATAISGF